MLQIGQLAKFGWTIGEVVAIDDISVTLKFWEPRRGWVCESFPINQVKPL